MKRWWYFLLGSGMFAGAQEATAQEGGWMVHLDSLQNPEWNQYAFSGEGRSVRQKSTGFLVFSHQASPYTGPPPVKTHLFTRRFSPDGTFMGELVFGNDSMNVNIGYIDPIDDHPDGGFVACLGHWWGRDQIFQLCLFDEQGDSTWCKEFLRFVPEDSIQIAFRDVVVLPDGGYLLGGFRHDDLLGSTRSYLMRLSSNADTIWSRIYDGTNQVISVETHPLGGYTAAGLRLGTTTDRNFVMRVDENGEELWRRNMGGHSPDGNIGMLCQEDGSIVTWSTYSAVWVSENPLWKMIIKWDAEGELIWERMCDFGFSYTYDIGVVPDGGYVATGISQGFASLDRFNGQGDSLWTRQYWWFWNWNILYDVEPTSDGGFVATGSSLQNPGDPTPGLWTIVVLKTDSLGCVIPGCHTVGVQEYAVDLQAYLRVWPNPVARGMPLQLAFSPPEGFTPEGRLRVVLQDALGREVLVERLAPQPSTVQLPTSQLSSGIYYLHLADEQRWLAGAKIIVE